MTDSLPDSLAAFSVDGHTFALDVAKVERVVPAAEITPLPGAPRGVRGVLDVGGTIVPVYDLRKKFGWPEKPMRTGDFLIIAHTSKRLVALIADVVMDVIGAAGAQWFADGEIVPGFDAIDGVITLGDEIIFIHDLDRFLASEDERALTAALRL